MIVIHLLAFCLAFLTPVKLPFTVDATENDSAAFPEAPRVESSSFAQWKGRWVFIGGRIAGYHSMGGAAAEFARAEANPNVWVVDTTAKPARTYHVPVDSLPAKFADLKDEWMSTGQLFYQDGPFLYIAGGYGQDSTGHWVTYPLISKIDLPRLIAGVMQGKLSAEGVTFSHSKLVQSAGGELVKLTDNYFYVVMGHVFMGTYTAFEGQGERNAQPASQAYLNEIRRLRIACNSQGDLSVTLVSKFRDEIQFHRRDLNVTKMVAPEGVGLAAYGGVFTPDTQLSYSKPIYLLPNGQLPLVESTFDQKMNAYKCAKLLLYDRPTRTMYTTFFGGISRFAWDSVADKFIENIKVGDKTASNYLDGLQWSDQISTILRAATPDKKETSEFVQPGLVPGFVGTDAFFIPVDALTRASAGTDILDLGPLRGTRTLVGYIYGGIRAFPFRFPYTKTSLFYNAGTVPTKPNDLILKVYLAANKN